MNRLVIIGNGFDLAHGLPTSYKHFIDDFWINFKENCKSDLYKQIVTTNDSYDGFYKYYNEIKNFRDFKSNLSEYCQHNNYRFFENKCVALHNTIDIFRINNDFFLKINNESLENWVDIENLYYSELKKIVKSKCPDIAKSEEYWIKEQKKQVEKLNLEFEDVKSLLEIYLSNKVETSFETFKRYKGVNDWTKFYHILCPISIFNNEQNLKLEFNDKDDKNDIDLFFIKEQKDKEVFKAKSFLLSFNYTNTLDKYLNSFKEGEINSELNHVHGRINDLKNKINFGFGDEMDDDYKSIENINDNEYLKHFKSFQYLQNSNYSNLLSYIDSDKFQVLIMGHSCGLSDRTLLNTIFEHNNCRSIKVFYHQWKDKETDEMKDNYTEITQNISRHFNKKKLMREKIVNKTLCQPLPQIQLPKKV